MGPKASRFEQTDWPTTNGMLTSNKETIDGSDPTSKYGVYTLHKRNVNQREFDVIDDQGNLLYTTRCIEGTLSWFDVLGPGLDQYLVRVQVDVGKRSWVVYRFGRPCFSGQFPDMTATKRVREIRGQTQPYMFKKCCITVNWSRYSAIVHNYGPPEEEKEEEEEEEEGQEKTQKMTVSDRSSKKARSSGEETKLDPQPPIGEESELHTSETMSSSDCSTAAPSLITQMTTQDEESKTKEENESFDEAYAPDDISDSFGSTRKKPSPPGMEESLTGLDKSLSESRRKPQPKKKRSVLHKMKSMMDRPNNKHLEGVLQLDKPILKCDEIVGVGGKHQTMLVGKEEAEEIKELTIEEAEVMGTDAYDPDTNLKSIERHPAKSPSEDGKSPKREGGAKKTSPIPAKSTQSEPRSTDVVESSIECTSVTDSVPSDSPSKKEETEEADDSIENEGSLAESAPKTEMADVVDLSEAKESNEASPEDLGGKLPEREGETEEEEEKEEENKEAEKKQSLVGYWKWDNTMRIHKMDLHIAEGSDLALHVVLAIICNQVRIERMVFMWTI